VAIVASNIRRLEGLLVLPSRKETPPKTVKFKLPSDIKFGVKREGARAVEGVKKAKVGRFCVPTLYHLAFGSVNRCAGGCGMSHPVDKTDFTDGQAVSDYIAKWAPGARKGLLESLVRRWDVSG
jgi:hypothetical protein